MTRLQRFVLALALVCAACDSGGGEGTQDAGPGGGGHDASTGKDAGKTPAKDAGMDAAQSGDTGAVHGRVIDSTGAVLSKVAITLGGISAKTNAKGEFQLAGVPVGAQQGLIAKLAGFSTGRQRVDVLADSSQLV